MREYLLDGSLSVISEGVHDFGYREVEPMTLKFQGGHQYSPIIREEKVIYQQDRDLMELQDSLKKEKALVVEFEVVDEKDIEIIKEDK